jgi:HSP20 family protein
MTTFTTNEELNTKTPAACCQARDNQCLAKNPHTYRAPVDVYEAKDRFIVLADMPGTSPDGIEITVDGNMLEMIGKVADRYEQLGSTSRQEYGIGDFHRHFRIGSGIVTEDISATYRDGILNVNLPKQPVVQPRKGQVMGG